MAADKVDYGQRRWLFNRECDCFTETLKWWDWGKIFTRFKIFTR